VFRIGSLAIDAGCGAQGKDLMGSDQREGVAVVTGASRGIGEAIAERLASKGMSVACAATSTANAEPVARRLADQYGVATLAVGLSVQDPISVQDAMAHIEEVLGPISVLVNNAGIAGVVSFLDMPVESFDKIIAVNLRGVFLCSQAAARRMVASGTKGAIVNIGSVTGINGLPNRIAYGASKAAVHHMTKVMALDLVEHGIRVNCIAPGYIKTDLIRELIEDGKVDESLLKRRIPMGELGGPADVASAVDWISSSDARYVTGETLLVDGGWVAYGYV
jgi:NAD(P)-dependent dehydrogenase (short-subunit alcohol dehydrogenase family)